MWEQFPPRGVDDLALYEAVRSLSDHELGVLHTLLAALTFGQAICERLDTRDSLFTAWPVISMPTCAINKSELVNALPRHFANAHAASDPSTAQIKVRQWLPEAMLFTAVDPDAPQVAGEPDDHDDKPADEE